MNSFEIENFLPACLRMIEDKLNWGNSEYWTTSDFEKLRSLILESTGVQLSAATLKRIWGNLQYSSKPSITTLNTLACFVGFEDWRAFAVSQRRGHTEAIAANRYFHRSKALVGSLLVILLLIITTLSVISGRVSKSDFGKITFNSRKMLHAGVPNSVIFEYNLEELPAGTPVFIQQSWDPSRKQAIAPGSTFQSSIYNFPGFYLAKLVVEDQIVKEQPLLIRSDGWLPIVEWGEEIAYGDTLLARKNGTLGLSGEDVAAMGLSTKPGIPWVSYHLVQEFQGITSEDLRYHTKLRNDRSSQDNVCQLIEIHLLFEVGAIMIPLSQPGCVSKLQFVDADGEIEPSKLGVATNEWVEVDFQLKGGIGSLQLNRRHVYDISYPYPRKQFVGIRYRFKGGGQVDSYRITDSSGQVKFEDGFNLIN